MKTPYFHPFRLILSFLLMPVGFAWSADAPDKSRFTLFNPTPRELMRELSTDRPDKTESPYTVDAGHFQIESDLVSYSRDKHNVARTDTTVESWSVASLNIKAGLLNQTDLQFVVPIWNQVTTKDRPSGTQTRNSGFGDVVLRLKQNLWGNDGGDSALAVMPFVKLPTNQDDLGNDAVEGGIIVPLALALPWGWSLGLMTEFDFNEDGSGGGRHAEFINTITVSHGIVGNLSGYVEFYSAVSTETGSDWIGTVDLGLTYALSDNVQLDAGINLGVTRSADDINPFIGVTWRF
ncbi:MAG: transporter [Opitutaceae bacterium]|nr:transporter [Verrucomicrobiales bacterium]